MKAWMIVLKDFCKNVLCGYHLNSFHYITQSKIHHHLSCLWSFLLPLRSLPVNGDISRSEAVREIAN